MAERLFFRERHRAAGFENIGLSHTAGTNWEVGHRKQDTPVPGELMMHNNQR
jgi:hypothetical protein